MRVGEKVPVVSHEDAGAGTFFVRLRRLRAWNSGLLSRSRYLSSARRLVGYSEGIGERTAAHRRPQGPGDQRRDALDMEVGRVVIPIEGKADAASPNLMVSRIPVGSAVRKREREEFVSVEFGVVNLVAFTLQLVVQGFERSAEVEYGIVIVSQQNAQSPD